MVYRFTQSWDHFMVHFEFSISFWFPHRVNVCGNVFVTSCITLLTNKISVEDHKERFFPEYCEENKIWNSVVTYLLASSSISNILIVECWNSWSIPGRIFSDNNLKTACTPLRYSCLPGVHSCRWYRDNPIFGVRRVQVRRMRLCPWSFCQVPGMSSEEVSPQHPATAAAYRTCESMSQLCAPLHR